MQRNADLCKRSHGPLDIDSTLRVPLAGQFECLLDGFLALHAKSALCHKFRNILGSSR
jgi:hypothetical protein